MAAALGANVSKALAIPANNRTGTIKDVEHIVILMQENRPFDHHFGTLRGVRGFADPRAVKINLPLQSGGTAQASVFLQPAGPDNIKNGFSVPAASVGGPANGVPVIPPFHIDANKVSPGKVLGDDYMGGTEHGWGNIHRAWNFGKYDGWAINSGPLAMTYFKREDISYHCALADAFTVLDNYWCSIMGPTNPNRCYMLSGSIGNNDYLGAAGSDGHGSGPQTTNGFSQKGFPYFFETLPEVLDKAGVTWKCYQDLAGSTFAPDFGYSSRNAFTGNFGDNTLLYFAQYANSSPGSSLFDNGATGSRLEKTIPPANSPASAYKAWQLTQFDKFRADVQSGKLPQVSWIFAPQGYTEHSDTPCNYGAWYISQILDILVSNPEVFSKTVFIVNYDEADGSFDHIVPPTPPYLPAPAVANAPEGGASTVDYHEEIVTTATPNAPIGLASRVPCIVISPWSKGGYVNSQVFDHTSTIQFIEKRFGVFARNVTPWRRAVCGDLTSVFNFKDPNDDHDHRVRLPSTAGFLPSAGELSGTVFGPDIDVSLNNVFVGVPKQEKGVRPARSLPYTLNVLSAVNGSNGTIELRFVNSGKAGAVFHVRSANAADPVRNYTVEAGKSLSGAFKASGSYDLAVYGPNGFLRQFKGNVGNVAAMIDAHIAYGAGKEEHVDDNVAVTLTLRNASSRHVKLTVLDAYSGEKIVRELGPNAQNERKLSLQKFYGWYDFVVTAADDPTFEYRLAGHVETNRDSISDPAMGGMLKLYT